MLNLVCFSFDGDSYSLPLTKEDTKLIFNTINFQAKYNEAVQIIMSRKNHSIEENRNEVLKMTNWIIEKEDSYIPIMWGIRRA